MDLVSAGLKNDAQGSANHNEINSRPQHKIAGPFFTISMYSGRVTLFNSS
jgi:hypothetical protein